MRKANVTIAFLSLLAAGCVGAAPTSEAVTVPSSPCDTIGVANGATTLSISAPRALVSGTFAAISATATDSEGNKTDVTGQVSWSSTNLLSASPSGGKLYGIGAGHVTITATLGEINASADVDVMPVSIQALAIGADAETSRSGGLTTWHVTAVYNDGSTADATDLASWSTSDPTIALVEQPGRIRALKGGMAMITASLLGVVTSAPLMVADPSMVELRIDTPSQSMSASDTMQLVATGVYDDGSTMDLTERVGWYTSDGGLATVHDGLVQGLSSGIVSISAATGPFLGTIDIALTE
ncbi:MAG TPA: hypothetical protein VN947_12550 [Polyangia bacterium]|nr:hypothetical protein [Polyangia bacterium]